MSSKLYTADGCEAADAGSYEAAFTLKDTDCYEWSTGSSDAAVKVPYFVDYLDMGFDDDAIVAAGKEYSVEWVGTKSTYNGTAKRATRKSSLFGAAGAAGELPNWILNWENGKPSSRSSSFYVYLCGTDEEIDEENCEMVVGYDAYGKKVDYLEILAWILGAEPSKEVELFDGTKVTARSFAEVREFGVKDTSVKEVALLINTSGNKNVYAHGVVEGAFTIVEPDTDPAPSSLVTKIALPDAYAGLVDNGDAQTGVKEGAGYVLSGDWKAADAGIYTAVVTPGSRLCVG